MILVLMTNMAIAQGILSEVKKVEISKRTINLPVNLETGIKFTQRGYSMPLVKIIVNDLAAPTIMNHRNIGEEGPCLFTNDAHSVAEVVQGNPQIIDTDFTITLSKQTKLNRENVCKVTLIEEIIADVRGFTFEHTKRTALPDRIAADCL